MDNSSFIATTSAPVVAQATPSDPVPAKDLRNEPAKERNASLWSDAVRELVRNPAFMISLAYILLMVSMAIVPKLWTSKDPTICDIKQSKVSPFTGDHLLGTSVNGCDYWSHIVYGVRPSLLIALLATFGITFLGVTLGVLSGFFGGWVDAIVSRIADMIYSLPYLLGALVFLTVMRKSELMTRSQNSQVIVIAVVLVILGWVGVTRIMRGSVLAAKNLDFVHAAKALGATNSRIMFRHILPNAIAPVIVVATIALGSFIAAEATLTFLGAGLQAPAVSWGVMIAGHIQYFFEYPYLVLVPCAFLVGTVLSFILMGDALRDALDPKLR
ncbi:ABC transporter permease [Catellatospora sp. NEAU-YM18]|nr:ABC transporter permease [Catellatospora tritici]